MNSSQNQNCPHVFKVTDTSTGEIICNNCASVLFEKAVDFGPENIGQTMDDYQSSARTGQKISLTMADMGLSTMIHTQDRDSSGKFISAQNKRTFQRLRRWDRNSKHANTKQSYVKAFMFLDNIRSKLGLPDHVVEKSAYIFRKAEQMKLLPGHSNKSVLCAVVYIACRLTDTPRTLTDIAETAGIKKKILQRVYRLVYTNLGIQSVSYNPAEFISRISNEANVSEKTKRDARKILELSQENGMTFGKNPMSMAAAAVYLAVRRNEEDVSQTTISHISGISAVTIRNRVKEMEVIF